MTPPGHVVQLGWFVDPKPPELPVWLMIAGLEALFLGGIYRVTRRMGEGKYLRIGGLFLGFGYFLCSLAVISQSYVAFATYLFLLSKAIEGAAAARFYRVLAYVLNERSFPSSGGLSRRLTYSALAFFIIFAGIGFFLYQVQTGETDTGYASFIGTYTVVLVGTTVIGVWRRVRRLRSAFATPVLLGFVLCVTGAEIYGYSQLRTEVLVTFAGTVAFSLGFWSLIVLWGLNIVSDSP